MVTLPLEPVIDVSVNMAGNADARNDFSLGLIIGSSPVIQEAKRLEIFRNMQEVVERGFTSKQPEYQAAAIYFSQNPTPPKLAIGRRKEGETLSETLAACRKKNNQWYGFTAVDATDDEEKMVLIEYAESSGNTVAFISSDTTDILQEIVGANCRRTVFLYSENSNAAVSLMGYAMGANAQNRGAGFTLAYKTLPGIKTSADLTPMKLAEIEGINGNVYITRGDTYDIVEPGVTTDGTYFDEVLGLDMLKSALQNNVMALLTAKNKIPQTEDGMTEIINALNAACQEFVDSGFIAPGVWSGPAILNLNTGDMLEKGFLFQSQPLALQLQQDREQRKSPVIYGAIKLAGAMQYVSIALTVNR